MTSCVQVQVVNFYTDPLIAIFLRNSCVLFVARGVNEGGANQNRAAIV